MTTCKSLTPAKRNTVAGSVLVVMAAVGVGCSSTGLSPGERGSQTQSAYIRAMTSPAQSSTTQRDAANTFGTEADASPRAAAVPVKAAPAFKSPAKIAVAQVGEVAPPESMLQVLRKHPAVFARINALPAKLDGEQYRPYQHNPRKHPSLSPTDSGVRDHIDSLCDTATSMGMDYLLLVGGTIDHRTNATPLSLLNITIVGAFIVPSDQTRATVKATAALIDLPTRQVVSISSAQLEKQHLTPAVSTTGENTALFKRMTGEVAGLLASQVVSDCMGAVSTTASDVRSPLAASQTGAGQ